MDIKKLVGTTTLALSLMAVSPVLASSKGELHVEGGSRSTSIDAGIVVEDGDDSRGRGEDEVRGRGSDDVRLETRSTSSDERIGHDSGDDDDSILSDDRGGTSTISGSRHDELEDIGDDHGGRRSRTLGSILSDELARFGIGSTSAALSASTTVTAEDRQDFAEIFVNFFAKIGGWFRGHGGRSED